MASSGIVIQHPNQTQHDKIRRGTFYAFGKAKGACGNITGEVKGGDGKCYPGRTIKDGKHWIIFFDLPRGTDYRLTVKGSVTGTQTATFDVETKNTFADFEMTYPYDTTPICNTFAAYGSSAFTSSVTGLAGVEPGNTWSGPSTSQTWCVHFEDVVNSPCDVVVTDGQHTARQNGVPVASSNCLIP